ncbi:MAG: ABC transporter ATP-binding protein [Acidimicrobiales bacterium]
MTLSVEEVTLVLGDGDDEVTALDRVSMEVGAGELVAVVGPSGSGKSSLLAVAGAMLRPTSGRVVIGDVDVVAAPDKERTRLRREHIGFVFQGSNLVPSLTATEQLLLVPHLDGIRPATRRDRAAALLDEVDMGHRADRRPHQLSGGERQRVGIARALMAEPAVLLVDEPTSALDHQRGAEIVELLARETHDRGVATVMVTHDTAMLDRVDRVLRMEDGRLAAPTSAVG